MAEAEAKLETITNSDRPKSSASEVPQEEADATKEHKEETQPSTTPADDVQKTGWIYLDASGQRQGPFETREMAMWHVHPCPDLFFDARMP